MRLNLITVVLLSVASVAPAQEPDSKNAVTWYSRAYERYKAVQVSDAEWEAFYQFEIDPFRTPPDHARQIMARFQPVLALVDRGLAQQSYAPSRDWTQSLNRSYSHLAHARNLARLLRYDVEVRLADNDVDGAMQRVTAGYRMAQQVGSGGPIIDGCVGIAIFALTEGMTGNLMDRGVLGVEQAAAILEATDSLDPSDPFKMRQAVRNDQKDAIDRMKQRYGSDDGTAHLMEDLGDSSSNDLSAQMQFAALSPDAIHASIQNCGKVLDRMAVAFDMPDVERGQREIDALDDQVKRGDFGSIAQHLLGSGKGVFAAMRLIEKQWRERRAILQDIVDKKIDPMSVANAAVWYMRAIAELEKADAARRDRIRAYAAQVEKPAVDQLADDLDEPGIRRVIELLTEASQIQRCDFSFSGGSGSFHGTFETYEGGMRDAARVLMADAVRSLHRLREGDDVLAVDHLVVAHRMAGHLATDKALTSSLTAHAIFRSADAVMVAAVEGHLLDRSQLARLAEAINALQQVDPFGYAAGVSRLRTEAPQLLAWCLNRPGNEPPESLRDLVAQVEIDRLLWLAVIGEQGCYDPNRDDEARVRAVQRLDDVISLDAMRQTLEQGESIRAFLLQYDTKNVVESQWQTIAPVQARMQEAPEDVNRALRRLGLPESESPTTSVPNR